MYVRGFLKNHKNKKNIFIVPYVSKTPRPQRQRWGEEKSPAALRLWKNGVK
jgi:hypothetical protein